MMELKGKKVLVVGLGKSGLAAALFLRRRGRAGDGDRRALAPRRWPRIFLRCWKKESWWRRAGMAC